MDGLIAILHRLNGIFAFALWDADSEILLIARDAFGVKPLYFQENESGFHFASEIKALPNRQIDNLDAAALDRYLSFLWCPGDGTPTPQVRKLKPGMAVCVKDGAIIERVTWYHLPVFQRNFSTPLASPPVSKNVAIRSTIHYLRQAVHRQMIADVPVGAFLSGGLDSSSVVALAREKNSDIRCFTIELTGITDEGLSDDLPYARRVAKYLKVPLEVVQMDSSRMAEFLPTMVAQLDEPLADPAPLNILYISRLAREHGIKVLLSGAGGDDLFTGYRRHQALMSDFFWAWLPQSARTALGRLTQGLDQRRPLFRRLRKLFNGVSLDGDDRLVNYFRWIDRNDLLALYTPEFRAALADAHAEDSMQEFLAGLPLETSALERMLALEQRFFFTDHNLNYTDKMSMAVGIEVRVPFLDLDLVEYAAQIPARYKQRGLVGKWVLKKAMEPYLPRDIIYRPKTGFGAPLRRWMLHDLRPLLGDFLSEESKKNRNLFDPGAVRRLITDNESGRVDASYTLLSLLCIEIWCRTYLGTVGQSRLN